MMVALCKRTLSAYQFLGFSEPERRQAIQSFVIGNIYIYILFHFFQYLSVKLFRVMENFFRVRTVVCLELAHYIDQNV